MSRRDRRALPALVALASALLLIGPMPGAGADPATEVVQGRYVRIVSSADWAAASTMGPGVSVRWDLEVSAAAPSPGTVRVGISALGDAPVAVDVRLCPVAWQGEDCAGGSHVLRSGWGVPRDGQTVELDTISSGDVAHVRLDVRLAGDRGAGATQIRVHADGFGDRIQTGPGAQLAATGGSVPLPLIVAGGVLLVAAALLLLLRRRRRGEGS